MSGSNPYFKANHTFAEYLNVPMPKVGERLVKMDNVPQKNFEKYTANPNWRQIEPDGSPVFIYKDDTLQGIYTNLSFVLIGRNGKPIKRETWLCPMTWITAEDVWREERKREACLKMVEAGRGDERLTQEFLDSFHDE